MELKVSGTLKSATGDNSSLASCRIEAQFALKPEQPPASPARADADLIGDPDAALIPAEPYLGPELLGPRAAIAVPIAKPIRVMGTIDTVGNFTMEFPDTEEIDSGTPVRFMVFSPSGLLIGAKEVRAAELGNPVRINVEAFEPIVLLKPEEPPPPPTRRVRGRVIERNGKPLPSSLQVLLLGREPDMDGDALEPILAAKADGSGYFSGEVANVPFDRVVALVSSIPKEIPIQLVDSLVPLRIPIVVEVPDRPAGPSAKDCGCADSPVARTPTQDELISTPGFSADLGTGPCIRFNVPNRAIEEFNFYSVVRTTQPQIAGITVGTLQDKPTPSPNGSGGGSRTLPPPPPLNGGSAVRAVSAATLEESIGKAVALLQPTNFMDALAQTLMWSTLESVIRGTVVTSGGKQLPATFFDQFPGWGKGVVWGMGGPFDFIGDGQAKLRTVIRKAAEAGAVAPTPPPGGYVPGASSQPAMAELGDWGRTISHVSIARSESMYDRLNAKRPPGRVPLDGASPVDWDSTPTFYQATSIAHGHLLHFRQVWYADGYSLGDLLYSLPLAPGQKKLVSVIDWERREQSIRDEFTSAEEGVTASLSRDRDLNEVVTGALSESSRGGSRNTTTGFGIGGGAAGNGSYQQFNFGALIGVSGGFGASDSSAFQDSSRNLSSSSLQTLRDRTLQSASAVRNLRSTIVQTARQGETVRATTEVIANHNHCHALTVQYFEVLRHFKVTNELADVQECLFVPFPMGEFDRPKVLRWRESLALYLKRPALAPAFDAARRIETSWSEQYTPVSRYADELVTAIVGELTVTILIPLPPLPEKPRPRPEDTAAQTEEAVRKALAPTEGALGVILAVATLGASVVISESAAAISDAAKATAQGARTMAESLLDEPSAEERYARFQREVMPAAAAGFVDQLELFALIGSSEIRLNGADFTLVSEYRPGSPLLVSVRGRITTPVARASISALVIKSSVPLPPGCRAIINTASLRYQTNHFRHDLVNDQRVNDDIDLPLVSFTGIPPGGAPFPTPPLPPLPPLPPGFPTDWIPIPGMTPIRAGAGAMLYTPLDEWEQRAPRLEDIRISAELVEHLNANLEYYHHAIWWTMDPNRRYLLLDGYQAPNAGGRSVASVVDNTLIGIVGNSLILPVARGNRLDPEFKLADNATLLAHYDPQSPAPPSRISLPTRGVFAEAVMGDCNACEEIDDTRFWRWEESPIDEPPALDAAAIASRRSEPNYGTPTPFPTPIVNIQNAPTAPDPAGVRAALEALGKQSFPDITGLAGTQANAAAAYAKAMDTAAAFGKEASALAQQASAIRNVGQTMRAIDKAEQEGKIDKEDGKPLRMSILGQAAGVSQTKETEAATKAIEKMPPEQITEVDTGKTKVKATPSRGRRNLIVNLGSEVKLIGEAAGAPLNGRLTIAFGYPNTEISSGAIAKEVMFPLFSSVAAASVSLAPGNYVLYPTYEPASPSDLEFLNSARLGLTGVPMPELVNRLFAAVTDGMKKLYTGATTRIRPGQQELNLRFTAEVRKVESTSGTVKLGNELGFTIGADQKVSFDSSKLGELVAKLAPMLIHPEAVAIGEGVAAVLSLFSVSSNINSEGKLTTTAGSEIELKFVPAVLQNARLIVVT